MGKAVEQSSSPLCCMFLSFGTISSLSYTSLVILGLLSISMPLICYSLAHLDHHSPLYPSIITMPHFWMAWHSVWFNMHGPQPLSHSIWHSGIADLRTTTQLTSNRLWSTIWWMGCALIVNLQPILYVNHALLAKCMQTHSQPLRIAPPTPLSSSTLTCTRFPIKYSLGINIGSLLLTTTQDINLWSQFMPNRTFSMHSSNSRHVQRIRPNDASKLCKMTREGSTWARPCSNSPPSIVLSNSTLSEHIPSRIR